MYIQIKRYYLKSVFTILALIFSIQAQAGLGRLCNRLFGHYPNQVTTESPIFSKLASKKYNQKKWLQSFSQLNFKEKKQVILELYQLYEEDELFKYNLIKQLNYSVLQKSLPFSKARALAEEINKISEKKVFSFSNVEQIIEEVPNRSYGEIKKIKAVASHLTSNSNINLELQDLLLLKYPGDDVLHELLTSNLTSVITNLDSLSVFNEFLDYLLTLKPINRVFVTNDIASIFQQNKIFTPDIISSITTLTMKRKLNLGDHTYGFFKKQHQLNTIFQKEKTTLSKIALKKAAKTKNYEHYMKVDKPAILNSAYAHRETVRQLQNRCTMNMKGLSKKTATSGQHRKNAKRYKWFQIIMGSAITGSLFSWANRNSNWDIDENQQIYERMTTEMYWVVIGRLANSYLVSNNKIGWIGKYGMYYLANFINDFVYSAEITLRYSNPYELINQKYDEMLDNPQYREELISLTEYAQKEGWAEKIVFSVTDFFASVDVVDGQSLLDVVKSEEDLKKPEVEIALQRLIAKKIYQDKRAEKKRNLDIVFFQNISVEANNSGFTYTDLLAFNRTYSIFASLKSVLVGMYIMNMLCKNSLNPNLSYIKAGLLFIADTTISNYLYFPLRNALVPSSTD